MINISAARKGSIKPVELNMAPLIDMVFILLIFFLVTTSFVKETGIDVNRPTASTAVTPQNANIFVGVTKKGSIYMEKKEIDIYALRANIERALAENPKSSVVVIADKESQTGVVIQVMDECRLAGAEGVTLAAGLP